MSVVIRPADPADDPFLESVENQADQLLIDLLAPEQWAPAPPGSSRTSEPGFVLVAELPGAGDVVGFVHVLERGPLAHLEQLSVLPRHGRRGYGRRLVGAATAEARRRGHAQMTLRTYADVPWNAPFYARLGFVESDPATDFHRQLVDVEERLGLTRCGRRVQMTAVLD